MKKYIFGIGTLLALLFLSLVGSGFYFNRIMNLPTGVMANTIIPGDQILVSGFYSKIERGDIMIFKFPADTKVKYCMRVIGLPGEFIQVKGQTVYINNAELSEKRIHCEMDYQDSKAPLKEISAVGSSSYSTYHFNTDENASSRQMKFGVNEPYKIPAGEYFVLGDSRDNSLDSRFWGTVKAEAMLFKAIKIINSPDSTRNFTDLK